MSTSLLRDRFDFRPDVLDVIISGKSALDTPNSFQLKTAQEASDFIDSYGYDLDKPVENAEVLGNCHEALNFIRKHFLLPENPNGLKLEVPRKILEITDVRDLFLLAGYHYPGQTHDGQGVYLRDWSCSLLKVMHTIAHIDRDLRSPYISDIQQQIFDRFYKFIHRDPDGHLYLGDDQSSRIDLAAFETKPKKSRDSIILKLLHKPENVAEDIFDRVGIRFVTRTRLGALEVVKFLKDRMIVIPANIKPSRSRNTLIDIPAFRKVLAEQLGRAESGKVTYGSLLDPLENFLEEAALTASSGAVANPDNPHSSEFYRAIQFTARQLIKLKNTMYDDLRELKSRSRASGLDEDISKILERIDLKSVQREIRFFYPYEVQIMDMKSHEQNERGRSAHSEYKRAQVQTALKRVMGSLVDAVR
ncbi:MAG: TIGR04552 family protein [Oligoflexia bacterium]|nr:TIGR04552 family protein [Oligoflexia bacterium]